MTALLLPLLASIFSFPQAADQRDFVAAAPRAITTSAQTVFVALLEYPDEAPTFSRDSAVASVNTMCAYFHDYSYGATTLTPTFTATFLLMPQPKAYYAGNRSLIAQDARQVAEATGYGDILTTYNHVVYMFAWTDRLSYRGFTSAKQIWMNDTVDPWLLTHEMGHSYGLYHAHRWMPCNLSNPVDSCGSSIEYGDCYDMMSQQSPTRDFNPFEKNRLGWLPAGKIWNVVRTATYRIHRFDDPSAAAFRRLAFTIPQPGTTRTYWIVYRYKTIATRLGATVMWTDQFASTLIDFHPITTGCGAAMSDIVVPIGATLTDQDLLITPIRLGGVAPDFWVDVQITLP
jgi:hypothetical protein